MGSIDFKKLGAWHSATVALGLALAVVAIGRAQTAAPAGTAALRQVSTDGLKSLPAQTVVSLTGLVIGSQVGRADLQAGADRLLQTGMFANVNYNFQTHGDGVTVTYHLEEAPRLPVYFDNFPWFSDTELADAIRAKLPYYDGRLPSDGNVVDQATDAVSSLLLKRGLNSPVEHAPIANPLGEGDILQFHLTGASLLIGSITFGDPALSASKAVQQHLAEIIGKEYSRSTIDVFLAEQIRAFYLERGFLRVKLGPPEVRLAGDPNQKLPEQLPVFIPVASGAAYKWNAVQWHGNSALSEITLNNLLGEKSGAMANGQDLEAGWDRIREQYGVNGYLEVKIDATSTYDDAAQTISYAVSIEEGPAYRYGKLVLSGLSLEGERRLKQAWPLTEGAVFDKSVFEEFLTKLETHPQKVFGDLPVHYDGVGHWLQTDPKQGTVDVLLDFKH
ncbi:MAG: POTRA domain-containing protein [Candidatus Acidiferrum sp.]